MMVGIYLGNCKDEKPGDKKLGMKCSCIFFKMNILFLGEPNDLNSEDCAIVQSTNLYLIDISCSIKSVIICEKKTYKEKS